jgi:hypothetical protein
MSFDTCFRPPEARTNGEAYTIRVGSFASFSRQDDFLVWTVTTENAELLHEYIEFGRQSAQFLNSRSHGQNLSSSRASSKSKCLNLGRQQRRGRSAQSLFLIFLFPFQSNTNAKVKLLDLDSYISFEKVDENFLLKAQRQNVTAPLLQEKDLNLILCIKYIFLD